MEMKWAGPMARPQYQLSPPRIQGCSKTPSMSAEGAGSSSMAWVKLFKKPGGALVKSYQAGSMLSLALTKGLLNEPGQNSCFLNSAVQVLWQLDIFRRSLRQLPGHFCLGDACIFCALKSIFSQFQQSRERALPSDSLRHALAETFKDEQRFQLGLMDDAAECFENILERIHLHVVSDAATESCTSKSCITHQKFAMTLYEQFVCRSCGASSDPLPFTELVHYVSTTALCQQVDRVQGRNERLRSDMFGELLQAANTIGDLRNCPSNCGQSIKIRRVLMNCPEIVTIGFVWDAEQSDLTEDVVRSLRPRLNLSGLFNRVTDENAKRSELHLVGMICYSSRHYSAFAYHTKSSKWVFFDDATVKEIGSRWKDVASKCIRGHFQPLLLFYTNPEGSPVSSEDAPRQTTMCSRYKAQVNGEVKVGSKKLDAARENAGPLRSNHQILPPPSATGPSRVKVPLGSPNKFREPFRENSQRAVGGSRKDSERGHRRAEPSQHKDMAYARSSSPPESALRQHADQRHRGGDGRSEKPGDPRGSQSAGAPGARGGGRKNDASPPGGGHAARQDGRQEPGERGAGRSRPKPSWRPVREVLNVDSVLSDLERRQQQQQHASPRLGKSSGQERVPHAEQERERERERAAAAARAREERRQKCLMTIYEDEQRHETESHSSLESSEGRAKEHQGAGRAKAGGGGGAGGGAKPLLRSDTWTIQRTESGYESSDRLSSGSTNPDSPGVDGSAGKEPRPTPTAEAPPQSRGQLQHQNRGDSKAGKHQLKSQGKNCDHPASHSHLLKCSPSSRRKFRYNPGSSKKGSAPEREPCAPAENRAASPEQPEAGVRGYLADSPAALRLLGKTSSSEWNSSDDLASGNLSEPEDRDSAYRSSNSETVSSESPCGTRLALPLPSHADPGGPLPPPQLTNHRPLITVAAPSHSKPSAQRAPPPHQGEAAAGRHCFCPRMLQEPSQTSPRPGGRGAAPHASPHRRSEPGGVQQRAAFSSDAGGSRSGADPDRTNPSSGESEERLPVGCGRPRAGGAEPAAAVLPQEVSLTTYFSVDNCMTDTYRLKYHHQRPLLLSATMPSPRQGAEHRDPGHALPADTHSSLDTPKSRPDTSHSSNKPKAKWNPVSGKGLDGRGYL